MCELEIPTNFSLLLLTSELYPKREKHSSIPLEKAKKIKNICAFLIVTNQYKGREVDIYLYYLLIGNIY